MRTFLQEDLEERRAKPTNIMVDSGRDQKTCTVSSLGRTFSHLKMDGCKTSYLLGWLPSSYVSFREGNVVVESGFFVW